MKRILTGLLVLLTLLLITGASAFGWASWKTNTRLTQIYDTHRVSPKAGPQEGSEADAIERGKHLVEARYACIECHGADFGGGVMIDNPALGQLLGPNLTSGQGGVVANYDLLDWDRIVRHGVLPDGRAAVMPSEDFRAMTDQELLDIVAYIRSVPAVDKKVPSPSFGPIGKMLIATGKLPLSADQIRDHHGPHAVAPPEAGPTKEFGAHLAQVCVGCHRPSFEGGPIAAGDPDWLPARNLTPHDEGLKDWTEEDFFVSMRQMKRPDGSDIRPPMSLMKPYAKKMTDVELRALWAYLRSTTPVPTGT